MPDPVTSTTTPPEGRPLLVWDGECGFCRRSVERLRYRAGDVVDTAPYQEVAAKARTQLERLAAAYATPAREAELAAIFKEATRLEIGFWEMGWRAGS